MEKRRRVVNFVVDVVLNVDVDVDAKLRHQLAKIEQTVKTPTRIKGCW